MKMETKKKAFYFLCSVVIAFLIILLNKISVAEGRAIGLGDLILRNAGLLCIFNSLWKYIRDR